MMIKKLFLSILLCITAVVTANAAKALGNLRTVKQPDGTMLSYCALGDENLHWTQTTDGVLIIWDNNAFYVGEVTGYGKLASTGIVAHNEGARSAEEEAAIVKQDESRATFFIATAKSGAKLGLSGNIITYTSPTICPHSGTITVPVALVQYSDVPFRVNAKYNGTGADPTTLPSEATVRTIFDAYFNQLDAGFSLGTNSVGRYFKDASEGNLTLKFELHGIFTLPHNHAYYGHSSSTSGNLYSDALTLLDDSVNFAESKYDSNGDGNVDMVTVLFAGAGANLTYTGDSSDPNDFWPACFYGTYSATKDGKRIPVIGAFAELAVYPTKTGEAYGRAGVGVTCHELSHGLGMPDLYDTNTSAVRTNYNNNGPEWWDLMDGGENINNGYWPIQYLAWEKDYFGWDKAVELTEPLDVTLKPLNQGGLAYMIVNPSKGTSPEYYIVEAVQSTEWNRGIFAFFKSYIGSEVPGGLLIEHVTNTALQSMAPNNTYSSSTGYKPNLTLVSADGLLLAQSTLQAGKCTAKEFIESLAGDQYPGTKNVTSLAAYKNYNGDEMVTKYPITDITRNSDGSISFKFMGGTPEIGDANADRVIDIADVAAIVAYLNDNKPEIFSTIAADVNGDGKIDREDVTALQNKLLKISE